MKYHIKRVQMPLTGVYTWGLFRRRQSPKPFALSYHLPNILATLAARAG